MNNRALLLFAVLVLVGWTALAAGVIAVFAGEPNASMQSHHHVKPPVQAKPEGPLLSDDCKSLGLDASVDCSA